MSGAVASSCMGNFAGGGGGGGGGSFSVNLSRTDSYNLEGNAPGTTFTLQPVIATGVDGVAPYSYAWTYVSGDTQIYPNNSNTATTRFFAYVPDGGDSFAAVYKCVVTDAASTVVDSANVAITIEAL